MAAKVADILQGCFGADGPLATIRLTGSLPAICRTMRSSI